jgi:hypothetical protein
MVASDVSAQAGPVTVIHGSDHGRTLELRIADKAPLKIGTTYSVVTPQALDVTGTRPGASLSFTNEKGATWNSDTGSLSISLVAGSEISCYFQGVELLPVPGVTGSFEIDGQVVTTLASR